VREFPLAAGRADYMLYVDEKIVGVIEAKREGTPLTGVEWQTDRYARALPKSHALASWRADQPLPFRYESTGTETRFTNDLDPEPRSREVFSFHRPETLARWMQEADADPPAALPELADAWLYTLRSDEVAEVLAVIAAADDQEPTSEPPAVPTPSPHADAMAQLGSSASSTRPFNVRLFGPPRVDALRVELRTGLRSKARDLLAYLLLHPDGVTVDQIVDAIWPDADPERGTERFRTTLGNLGSTLKLASGRPDIAVVEWTGSHYRIQVDLFDCDVWHFEAALHDAAVADNPVAKTAALERAVACRQGDLLEGAGAVWAEAPREDLRHRALDALVQLAELHQQSSNLDGAVAVLEQAIAIDPHAEDLYRKVMLLEADLGRLDAVRRTLRHLEARLDELDAKPDETTTRLAQQLLDRVPHQP
jgi:DNA-binding SARP family transcriptional activator